MSLLPEEKGQGKDVSGLPGYCLLITWADESKHAASDPAPPWVEGSGGMQSPPSSQTGWAASSSSSPTSTFHGDFTDQGARPPPSSDHHR